MEPIVPKDAESALPAGAPASDAKRFSPIPLTIGGAALAVVVIGALLIHHAESETNRIALSSEPKPVTIVVARATSFRAHRTYVGRSTPGSRPTSARSSSRRTSTRSSCARARS